MEKQLYQLKVDPELEAFMSPLSEAEQASLEENIVANGCRTPLVVWDGILVDGHHRYEICHRHNIPFAVEEQSFADKGEAMLWMFQEQRSHRNLSPVARVVMALKCKPILLEMGKKNQGHRSDLDLLFKSTKSHDTRKMIAEIADVSPTMAYKVEKISEVADADTMAALMREEIKVSPTYAKLCKAKKESEKHNSETAENASDDVLSDKEVDDLVDDIIADLQNCAEELIEKYNVLNSTDKMTQKIIHKLGEAWRSTEQQICMHLMNLPLQRGIILAENDESAVETVVNHNAFLRTVGLDELILSKLKEY